MMKMKGGLSPPSLEQSKEITCEEVENVHHQGMAGKDGGSGVEEDSIDAISEQVTLTSLHKRGEEAEPIWEKCDLWRQEQKTRAARRLEEQLKARWAIEELIQENLTRFHTHYNLAKAPTRPKDVAQLLMPKGAAAHEMAALAWLGDWRPSAVLDLLWSLCHSWSALSPALSNGGEQALQSLIHEIRIEEAVLDEEVAEIQAKCVLHLPFGAVNGGAKRPAMAAVQEEMRKIKQAVSKAQNLRFKAVEMVVKKVLSKIDAAEFWVAFMGIQDLIHQLATQQRLRKGPVSLPVKGLGM
ncbi:uncharacterized protein LOC127790526 [Diospyros lotus]|uniref:uncharacterized protein LOC127790526 n=1 Tax=Diospyros lotus TaxID=55363 RepID=UPI00225826B2|nr:uncharacterized protein LOC127790526 [Diospyros lotus]